VKVSFTPRARRRAITLATWWRKNRPAAPDLFDQELERAKLKLLSQPNLGQLYETVRERVIRRLLLPKTEQHVYYSVDDAAHLVIVHTIWGARRGRGPKL
jgi:plasmid stabilization system protein ParE